MTITTEQVGPSSLRVFAGSSGKVHIGDFEREVDGYYVFVPINNGSSWNAWIMRAVADKLDELNREWDEQVSTHFNKP